MAKVDKIEDIVVWQLAIELTNSIYIITNTPLFNKDFNFEKINKEALEVSKKLGSFITYLKEFKLKQAQNLKTLQL